MLSLIKLNRNALYRMHTKKYIKKILFFKKKLHLHIREAAKKKLFFIGRAKRTGPGGGKLNECAPKEIRTFFM